MQTLTPEEKQNFIIAMNNLEQAIEDTLNMLNVIAPRYF
jgi:hypothetical protein